MRSSSADWGLLVLRLGFAALMLGLHGGPRLMRAFGYFVSGQPWGFIDVVEGLGFPYPVVFAGLSTIAESLGVLLVGLGLWTRAAAFVVAVNLSVAAWSEVLKGDPFELPGMYLLVAVALVVMGGGRLTVMKLMGRK